MAHYVMSDVHGESSRFYAMLEKISFSPGDTLYILGDVIDRGPDGVKLVRQIMDERNMIMLLGNHEHMCIQACGPYATDQDMARWDRNGSLPTKEALARLRPEQEEDFLYYLKTLPIHLRVTVEGQAFYLVHGFPGGNLHDEVWGRPRADTPNPIPDCRVIVGHTPVVRFYTTVEEEQRYLAGLEAAGDHLRIFHGSGFIDLDCGCGHPLPVRALSCLRLEDRKEFYV